MRITPPGLLESTEKTTAKIETAVNYPRGKEGKTDLRVVISALDETEEVAGVTCRVVEAEYEDGTCTFVDCDL